MEDLKNHTYSKDKPPYRTKWLSSNIYSANPIKSLREVDHDANNNISWKGGTIGQESIRFSKRSLHNINLHQNKERYPQGHEPWWSNACCPCRFSLKHSTLSTSKHWWRNYILFASPKVPCLYYQATLVIANSMYRLMIRNRKCWLW